MGSMLIPRFVTHLRVITCDLHAIHYPQYKYANEFNTTFETFHSFFDCEDIKSKRAFSMQALITFIICSGTLFFFWLSEFTFSQYLILHVLRFDYIYHRYKARMKLPNLYEPASTHSWLSLQITSCPSFYSL